MTTAQIIIISILCTGVVLATIKLSLEDDWRKRQVWTVLNLFCFGFMITLFIAITANINDLHKKAEGKCPELEVVEGVYKIKK